MFLLKELKHKGSEHELFGSFFVVLFVQTMAENFAHACNTGLMIAAVQFAKM